MPADAAEIVRLAEHLAERVELVTGATPYAEVRALEDAIYTLQTGKAPFNSAKAPRYTASLDAAMTLVPEGWSVLNAWNPTGRCKCDLSDGPMDGRERRWIGARTCATPALALTAAALRARAAQHDHEVG